MDPPASSDQLNSSDFVSRRKGLLIAFDAIGLLVWSRDRVLHGRSVGCFHEDFKAVSNGLVCYVFIWI